MKGARLGGKLSRVKDFTLPVGDSLIKQIRVGQNRRTVSRVVFDLEQAASHSVFWLSNPGRFVIELRSAKEPASTAGAPARRRGATPASAERPPETLVARFDPLVAPPPPIRPIYDEQDAAVQNRHDVGGTTNPTNLNPTSDSRSTAVRSSYPDVAGNPPAAASVQQPSPATPVERYQSSPRGLASRPDEAPLPADPQPSFPAAASSISAATAIAIAHVPLPELGPRPRQAAEQAPRAAEAKTEAVKPEPNHTGQAHAAEAIAAAADSSAAATCR